MHHRSMLTVFAIFAVLSFGCVQTQESRRITDGITDEIWKCSDFGFYGALVSLTRQKIDGEDSGVATVSAAGNTQLAVFRIDGINLRWNFGGQNEKGFYKYSFIIEPNGDGFYFDIAFADEDGIATSSQQFSCYKT